MALLDPPQDLERFGVPVEPLAAPAQDGEVARVAVDEVAQGVERLPDGQVDDQAIVAEGADAGGVAVLGLQAPDEPGRGVGGALTGSSGDEVAQQRRVERRAREGDVDLGEVDGADAT